MLLELLHCDLIALGDGTLVANKADERCHVDQKHDERSCNKHSGTFPALRAVQAVAHHLRRRAVGPVHPHMESAPYAHTELDSTKLHVLVADCRVMQWDCISLCCRDFQVAQVGLSQRSLAIFKNSLWVDFAARARCQSAPSRDGFGVLFGIIWTLICSRVAFTSVGRQIRIWMRSLLHRHEESVAAIAAALMRSAIRKRVVCRHVKARARRNLSGARSS